MIKSIVTSLAKKYALGTIQEMVKAKGTEVAYWAAKVTVWIGYAEKALTLLKSCAAKLEDGALTDEEAEQIVAEATAIVQSI